MADVTFSTGLAVQTQSGLGSPATIPATGTVDSDDGMVLGDRESGDAESGITLPDFVREESENADLGFTAQASDFERVNPTNLQIAWKLKGNGATATPSVGEAQALVGIDALLQGSGLTGTNGVSGSEYVYTPSVGLSTTYLTVRVWVEGMTWLFQDVLVDELRLTPTPGEFILATASLSVGSHDPATQFSTVTPPTFDYGTQSTLSAPRVISAGFNWLQPRGFESWEIALSNSVETFDDSNQATGKRLLQTQRRVSVTGVVYSESADSDAEFQELSIAAAPTADAAYRVGTAAGAADTINGVQIAANNLQVTSYKPNRIGRATSAEVQARATGTVSGGEFTLTLD